MKILYWPGLFIFAVSAIGAQGLTDPTRPQNVSKQMDEPQQNALSLTAIFISGNGKHAIINGKSYREGQVISGFEVLLISSNKVELSGPEGKQSLFVNNNNFKKDAHNGF